MPAAETEKKETAGNSLQTAIRRVHIGWSKRKHCKCLPSQSLSAQWGTGENTAGFVSFWMSSIFLMVSGNILEIFCWTQTALSGKSLRACYD